MGLPDPGQQVSINPPPARDWEARGTFKSSACDERGTIPDSDFLSIIIIIIRSLLS
jgi:hypothetical protein